MNIIELKVPTSWGELTREQLLSVAEILTMKLTREEMLVTLFCRLADVKLELKGKSWILQKGKASATIKRWEIACFSERFSWILDTQPKGVANPTAADDYIRDLSFGDWFETDTQLRLYEDDSDMTHFDDILPLLKEAPRKMTLAEATAYKLWWWSVQDMLAETYPNVFERKDPDAEPAPYEPFKTLQDFHLLLNDNHPQDNERIDGSNVHDVLSAIDNKISGLKYRQELLNKV